MTDKMTESRAPLRLNRRMDTSMPVCADCEELLTSGTYGAIFSSKQTPATEVIKGTLRRHGELGCPEDFKNEFRMARLTTKVLDLFNDSAWYRSSSRPWKRPIVASARPRAWRLEDGGCFYSMDRIYPLPGREELLELTPGRTNDAVVGGALRGLTKWKKLGAASTDVLLREVFGITLDDWAALLGRFVGLCHRAGLVLNDVEFIVGTLGPIHPPQIFLVDFDKVYLSKPASGPIESINRLTLSQFPSDRTAFTQAYKATLEASPRDDASLLSVVTPSWLASELDNVDAAMMVSSAVGERTDRSEQREKERSRSRSPKR